LLIATRNKYDCKKGLKKDTNSTLEKSTNKNYNVAVIIAALNEEEGIGLTLAEIRRNVNPKNVLVIDGRSRDRTVEVAKGMGAKVFFQDSIGKGDAIAKAVEHIGSDVDYVVVTDADYTYPAAYVPKMIEILETNPEVGMVCGNRFNGQAEKRALHNLFYLGNRLLAFTHNLLNGVNLEDPLTGLRVIRAKIMRDWKVKSKGFDIEVELNHQVERKGYGIMEIPINYRKRIGQKKLKASNGATILKRILLELTY
jgi:dolichol-phosphate mannosyltransferase